MHFLQAQNLISSRHSRVQETETNRTMTFARSELTLYEDIPVLVIKNDEQTFPSSSPM